MITTIIFVYFVLTIVHYWFQNKKSHTERLNIVDWYPQTPLGFITWLVWMPIEIVKVPLDFVWGWFELLRVLILPGLLGSKVAPMFGYSKQHVWYNRPRRDMLIIFGVTFVSHMFHLPMIILGVPSMARHTLGWYLDRIKLINIL